MSEFTPPLEGTYASGEIVRIRGAKHDRTDNARMRAIPRRERLLTIVCGRSRRRIFAVGTTLAFSDERQWEGKALRDVLLIEDKTVARGYATDVLVQDHLCPCGQRHPVDLMAVWEHMDQLRHAAANLREIDVARVAAPLTR